jgi:3-dehydrosphinganine reductase
VRVAANSALKLQADRHKKSAAVNSSFYFINTMDANISYWTIGSIVLGFLLVLPSIMGLFSKNKFDVKGKVCIGHPVVHQPRLTTPKTVLLTGASEGVGLSVAKQLAQKGASIIIVARNVGRLEEALGQIKVSLLPQRQTMLT